jgi:hypothetical protein
MRTSAPDDELVPTADQVEPPSRVASTVLVDEAPTAKPVRSELNERSDRSGIAGGTWADVQLAP